MRKWIALLGAMVLGIGLGASGCTPIPRPQPDRTEALWNMTVPLVIEADDRVRDSRLQIPRNPVGNVGSAAAAGEETSGRADAGRPRLHTIIAGVALSLALTFSGLWFVRHRIRFIGQSSAVLLAAITLLGVGGVLWADIPGPWPRPRPDRFPAPPPASGQVIVEIVDKGESVKLIVNFATLREMTAKAGTGALPKKE